MVWGTGDDDWEMGCGGMVCPAPLFLQRAFLQHHHLPYAGMVSRKTITNTPG